MRAAVDEEGREAVAKSRGSVVDGKLGKHEMQIPVVLAAVGVGAQSVADHTVSPLHLGIGVFVVGRADDEGRAHALHEGAEHGAREVRRELGIVVHHQHVREPVQDRRHM